MAMTQRSTVVGVFEDYREAEHAVDDLHRAGFRDDQVGIARRGEEDTVTTTAEGSEAGSGAATGLVTGGVIGGILGALAAGLIPGIGPVIAGGILAGVLGGAAVGAAAGGLLGALVGMGVPEDEARYYDEEFRGGRTIVTVKADGRYDDASRILRDHGAYDVETRDMPRTGAIHGRTAEAHRPTGRTAREGEGTLELREEELRARKETTEAGKVEVEKDVVTEHRTIDVPVTREEVYVERRPVDRRPSDRPIDENEEIEVKLREEHVTAEKRPVVYEEVEVGKRQVQETEQVSGTVDREVAEVKEMGGADVRGRGTEFASWDEISPSYRTRWQQRYGTSGGRWEDYEPGYRYGYEMAHDPRYRGREWSDLETEFRSDYGDWSRRQGYRHEENAWERMKDNAREAWDEARAKTQRR